ncbi:ankyrin repeat and SAM domain-containing protein 3-like [Momordica charantia]|uniref:Ankyrin repeat and SAM domain-containing protein 3-like n=1 Tax=Momordica charantia TaxID=3673 RepID=A0A6J1C523_MOMCH|nr:ankyrin repeat and SAM domain-containing protein 3-like [Momordica charantia]
MLVMNVMSSKRQRRPNVRLGEIGDISAAWACGFSQGTRERLAHREWKNDFVQTVGDEENPIVYGDFKPSSPKFTVSELGVSPQISTELQQNGENNNPNSSELALEQPTSAELIDMTKSKLKFSDVTRKCRDMKRRGRSKNTSYAILGGSWSSKHSSDDLSVDEKECEGTGNSANGFGDFSDHQIPSTSKEEYGIDQPSMRRGRKLNSNARVGGEKAQDKPGNEEDDTNAVGRWLEEVGFGRYAGVFEMHEVDEEALPLLTIEDLKEIGVLSVGARRKLYNAIQQFRGGGEEAV